jgi:hypothetical protein
MYVCMYVCVCVSTFIVCTTEKSSDALLDGAYFGATFTHMFFMQYPKSVPKPPSTVYVPRVYGFKVHESSASRHNGPKASVPGALQRSRMPVSCFLCLLLLGLCRIYARLCCWLGSGVLAIVVPLC